jgi:GntR family transcriptional regulator, transcriptional repressor for pyruvate dehydrogenase complex
VSVDSESLVERAIREVREHIRVNDLKVGDTLPGEGRFATELGVSRAVMREAFGALAALKLIDVANGRRARVGAIDGSVMATSMAHAVTTTQISLAEVWDVRRTLEMRTVELAAGNRTQAQAVGIVEAAAGMRSAKDDLDALVASDILLHQRIASASRNELFHQIIRSFEPLMRVAVPSAWHTRETTKMRRDMVDLHESLAAAILREDAELAATEMSRHFDATIGDLFRS